MAKQDISLPVIVESARDLAAREFEDTIYALRDAENQVKRLKKNLRLAQDRMLKTRSDERYHTQRTSD